MMVRTKKVEQEGRLVMKRFLWFELYLCSMSLFDARLHFQPF